ncbi:MAG: hypothetical protein CVU55_08445 [Deltaproteobacteria bacterium HGW-Deltaproteobacteria-13]|nr:MAG: hypothetical protein CVU55_08445 [Deltaproteobacteria bacterium HGW-Deltaproteobacteria-13]
MRIWDVNPGYLNRQSLLGEHRELHAIVSIFINNKKGYSRHPETLRWQGFGWALNQRHRLLVAEMKLRGYIDRSPVFLKTQSQRWPEVFVDSPAVQFSILSGKYTKTEQGRIPLPQNAQQLWAQHKYSVMARDVAEYKRIGRWVASGKTGNAISDIYPELVSLLRRPPGEGNLRNAIQHMWGYVSPCTTFPGKVIERKSMQGLLKEIQRLTFLHNIVYLKESTALGELSAWARTTKC